MTTPATQPMAVHGDKSISAYGPARSTIKGTPLTPDELRKIDSYMCAGWPIAVGTSPPGGERGVDVARRSSLVLEEIERVHPAGNVLVVSHKATTRIILCSLLGIDVGRYRDRLSMPVASLSVVEMTEQGPLLKSLGDRSHLNESLGLRPDT